MLFLTNMAGALSTSTLLGSNHREIQYNIGMTYDTKITTLTALSNLQREFSINLANAQNKFNHAKDNYNYNWGNSIEFWSKQLKRVEDAYNEIARL